MTTTAPIFRDTAASLEDRRWFQPVLVGSSMLAAWSKQASAARGVLSVLERLTADEFMLFVRDFYSQALKRFGDDWQYADINTVLYSLSSKLQVYDYMEIGVRRGRSMAMIAANSPDASLVGFDLWIENYSGMENPGQDFVRAEMGRVGFRGKLEFMDGDSKVTVPRFFNENPDRYFDLITVDGDHSREGAIADLRNVIPRLKQGGVLVFDDISNIWTPQLAQVWTEEVVSNPRFSAVSFDEVGLGVGFAIKKY